MFWTKDTQKQSANGYRTKCQLKGLQRTIGSNLHVTITLLLAICEQVVMGREK